jgi:hypothetical protein
MCDGNNNLSGLFDDCYITTRTTSFSSTFPKGSGQTLYGSIRHSTVFFFSVCTTSGAWAIDEKMKNFLAIESWRDGVIMDNN